PMAEVLDHPRHPYTQRLLAAQPRPRASEALPDAPVVMTGTDIRVWYPIRSGLLRRTVDHVKAVDGVSVTLREGRTLGVVGESGSGKTTLALALLRLERSQGRIEFLG